ncbi:MAG: COQ9 family protein [Alphaproteobacteria bacterium]|nr:COQ9 family protein [Alphaproteobacteria bacterium]
MELDALRRRLAAAAVAEVPFEGWSAIALQRAARDLRLAADDVERAFPDGARDLIEFWAATNDERMIDGLTALDLDALKLRQRVAQAIKLRLGGMTGEREAMRRALSFLALPQNAGLGARLLYRTVDTIWYAVGDRSTDYSFYTKRALLGGVYAATVLYWVDDRSEGSLETWGFLERRLNNVMSIPKLTERARIALRALPNPLRLFRPPALR